MAGSPSRQAYLDRRFAEGIAALRRFVDTHGHAVVQSRYRDPEGFNLYKWVRVQRQHLVRGELSPARTQTLRALGVSGGVLDDMYEERIALLREIKTSLGSADVPVKLEYAGVAIGKWLAQAKFRVRMGSVRQRWVDELKALGIRIELKSRTKQQPAMSGRSVRVSAEDAHGRSLGA